VRIQSIWKTNHKENTWEKYKNEMDMKIKDNFPKDSLFL